jgi:hypothetical protein
MGHNYVLWVFALIQKVALRKSLPQTEEIKSPLIVKLEKKETCRFWLPLFLATEQNRNTETC